MLRLRPLRPGDEAAFRAGHAELAAEGHLFGLGFTPGMAWDTYLKAREEQRAGRALRGRFVPNTFLVAEVDGDLVGRVSIRHELNDFLAREGGHIGYCVLPAFRRRGYATEILRQALIVARATGIDRVLVTCDNSNVASIKVIEACGGKLDSVIKLETFPDGVRRYWID
jgi:predicted acetyltransferase